MINAQTQALSAKWEEKRGDILSRRTTSLYNPSADFSNRWVGQLPYVPSNSLYDEANRSEWRLTARQDADYDAAWGEYRADLNRLKKRYEEQRRRLDDEIQLVTGDVELYQGRTSGVSQAAPPAEPTAGQPWNDLLRIWFQ